MSLQFLLLLGLAIYSTGSVASGGTQIEQVNDDSFHQVFSVNIENDSFTLFNQDKDYTFAFDVNYTLHFDPRQSHIFKRLTTKLHDRFGSKLSVEHKATSFNTGLFGFTPKVKSLQSTFKEGRPYSSLVYFTGANFFVDQEQHNSYSYELTLGLLGLNTFRHIQNAYHTQVGFKALQGWAEQLSQGGEFTGKLNASWQKVLKENSWFTLNQEINASVGYATGFTTKLYMRLGNISSPWWHFQPTADQYGTKPFSFSHTTSETYVSMGIFQKVHAYSAFLQGQLARNKHALTFTDTNPLLIGTWFGFHRSFKSGLSLKYQTVFQTSEIRKGKANRPMYWGGVNITQRF